MSRELKPCGTPAAYTRHLRNGEKACRACMAAHAKAATAYRPDGPLHARRGRSARFYAKVALPDENGCMLWLGDKVPQGYGVFKVEGRRISAHRVSLWDAEGPPPDDARVFAAHSCRRTDCVAPAHLRWASHTENMADKRRDGTENIGERNPAAKLTDAQATAIRTAYAGGGVTYRELTAEYGVSSATLTAVIQGKTWRHLIGDPA